MFYDQVNPNPIPEIGPISPGREFSEPGAPIIHPQGPDREITDPPEPHIDEPMPGRETNVPDSPPEYQPSTAMTQIGFTAQGPKDDDNEHVSHATMPPGPEQDIDTDASKEDASEDEEPVNFNFPDPATGNGQF